MAADAGRDQVIPDSDDDMRGRPKNDSPKKPRLGSGTADLTVDMMRALLAETRDSLMQSTKDAVRTEVQALEVRQNAKFQQLDDKVAGQSSRIDDFEKQLSSLQSRMDKLEDGGSTTASSDTPDSQRKLTLVVGGFPRDSRKQVVLDKVQEMITALRLDSQIDRAPFCTGPRTSFCLLPFVKRAGETHADARDRMHKTMGALIRSQTVVEGAKKPLWIGPSKTREERAVAAHCTFVRKIVAYFSPDRVADIDCDYGKGTTWLGRSKLGCIRSSPEGDNHKLFRFVGKPNEPWVDLSALASELQSDVDEVESYVQGLIDG